MKISIIVPVYNTELFVSECLYSLLNQTYPASGYEVVVVSDGSTDGSLSVLRSFQRAYSNLVVYDRPHGGVSAALEFGVLASRGEWLAFVDSDDWVATDFLETMAGQTAGVGCDMAMAHMVLHQAQGNQLYRCSSLEPGFYDDGRFADVIYPSLICKGKNQVQYSVGVSRGAKLFRRELVLRGLPYCSGLHYAEDKVLVVASVLSSKGILVLGDYYPYHYRLKHKAHALPDVLYPTYTAVAEVIGRIAAAAETYDFASQLKSFRVLGLMHDIDAVIRDDKGLNRAILSEHLKSLYEQGCADGILPSSEHGGLIYWELVRRGCIGMLRSRSRVGELRKVLYRTHLSRKPRWAMTNSLPAAHTGPWRGPGEPEFV